MTQEKHKPKVQSLERIFLCFLWSEWLSNVVASQFDFEDSFQCTQNLLVRLRRAVFISLKLSCRYIDSLRQLGLVRFRVQLLSIISDRLPKLLTNIIHFRDIVGSVDFRKTLAFAL